jgi:hypothetical protein
MPAFLYPKRDTEGLPAAVVDNNISTNILFQPGSTLNISYVEPKTVYAIIIRATIPTYYFPLSEILVLYITPDGQNYFPVPPARLYNIGRYEVVSEAAYWFINQSIKGWRLQNIQPSNAPAFPVLREILVLVEDSNSPLLNILYPDSIEIIDNNTTHLDFFSGLSNISDGNDNTYAIFNFRGGYTLYTLYLKGLFAIPMATVISPFILIEVDPLASNIGSKISHDLSSHGYFHWGAVDNLNHTSGYVSPLTSVSPIANSPKLQWSQKVKVEVASTGLARGIFTDSFLSPTAYDSSTALSAPLEPHAIINSKTLYVPYFFSLRHWPIFIAGQSDYIYYATNDSVEPFVYTAANGSTGKIILKFGLRIQTTSSVSSNFAVKIYGMGFLCFPQMDFETPLAHPPGAVWYAHVPQGNVTRDNNEATESSDITTAEKFVSIYPTAVDVSPGSGRLIRFRIRSTSGGDSNFTVKRYYGFHRASDDTILWYSQDTTYNVGSTLQSFDVLGEDQYGQTKVIKVEIIPI